MTLGRDLTAITPSDTVNSPVDARGERPAVLRFGTGGTVAVVTLSGAVVSLGTVANGFELAVPVLRVNETGTTADDIVGIYV